MPRKVNYGVDYDDVYGDDYEYEDDYDEWEENAGAPETEIKQEILKTGVWRCPICTYDNEDSMSACDICGVLRYPLLKVTINGNTAAVGGMCKDSGASVMAKSLFASLPRQTPIKPIIFGAQDDVLPKKIILKSHKIGNIRAGFLEFDRAFTSQNCHKVNLAAHFKFDAPSPDDVISNGLRSLKLYAKDTLSSEKETKMPVKSKSAAKGPNSSSALGSRERHRGLNEKESSSGGGNEPNISYGTMNTVSLSSKSGNSEIINEQKATTIPQYKPEKWMFPDKVEDGLSQLNLAIVGHVDSGKSTLSGRLLHLLGRISPKEMHKYEKEAKEQGKGSFAFAWALDESIEERERGITMTVAVAFFNSRRYRVVLLDSPGHRDFVPNMISGATQADAAVLVVDASMGSFEAGMDATGGQTREHAQLIRSFGVDQIIVGVNKMDVVQYSEERFDVVKQKLGTVLRSCGFKDSSISWIPLSAMENQNLLKNPSDARLSWFKGQCLLDAIDSLQLPARDFSKPPLMPICDVIKSESQGKVSACGKLESGAIRTGFKVLIMPSRKMATIRSLERDSQVCNIARAGDNVTVNLQGIEGNCVTAGGVMCHPDFPVPVSNHLELKILVLDVSAPILIGSQLEIHIHHAKEAARVAKIVSLLDPKTGNVTKKFPRCLLAKQNAVVEVVLQESICVEEYSNCRALGRVSLRALGRTIALGVVTQIIKGVE